MDKHFDKLKQLTNTLTNTEKLKNEQTLSQIKAMDKHFDKQKQRTNTLTN